MEIIKRCSFPIMVLFLILTSSIVFAQVKGPFRSPAIPKVIKDRLAPLKKKALEQLSRKKKTNEKNKKKSKKNKESTKTSIKSKKQKKVELKNRKNSDVVEITQDTSKIKPLSWNQKVRMDFEEASLEDVVRAISKMTGKNFILDTNLLRRGKITILSPKKVTVKEAYDAFLTALDINDMTIVPVGSYLKIVQKRDAAQDRIPTYVEGGKLPKPQDKMITMLVSLKHTDVDVIHRAISQLITKNGKAITYPQTNTLILADTAANVHRLLKIIEKLDVPGGMDEFRLVQLKYADAEEMAKKLSEIFKASGAKRNSSRRGSIIRPKPARGEKSQEEIQVSLIVPDERTNQIIVVANEVTYKKILKLVEKLDVPVAGEGQIHVYYLKNADAEELANTLSGVSSRAASRTRGRKGRIGPKGPGALFSGEVSITADKNTNSLVIIASPNDYKNIKRVIQMLDIPRRQVFVEAAILEVTLDKTTDIGLAFHGAKGITIGGETVPLFGGSTFGGGLSSLLVDPTSLVSLLGFIGGIRGPELEELKGLFGVSIPSFGVMLHALQSNSNVNIISTPHLLTTDNEEAEIIVGQNIPFIAGFTSSLGSYGSSLLSGSSSNNEQGNTSTTSSIYSSFYPLVSIQREDVALKLKLKPQISEGDTVRMDVEVEISDLLSMDPTLGPTTSKRSAKTVIVVRDNQTAVIGGLIKNNVTIDQTKIPLLGDIPVIGQFFRTSQKKNTKTNLLIFLTPYIIRNREDFRRIFERKMEERHKFMEQYFGKERDHFIERIALEPPTAKADTELEKQKKKLKEGKTPDGDIIITPDKGEK